MKLDLIHRSNFYRCLPLGLFSHIAHPNTISSMKSSNDSWNVLYGVLAYVSFPSFPNGRAAISILFLS